MKVKGIVGTLAVMAVLGFATVSMAQNMGYGGYHNQHGYGYHGYGYQGAGKALTPEQQEVLRTESEKFQTQTLPIRQELETKRMALRDAMYGENIDKATVIKLRKEITALQDELFARNLDFRASLKEKGLDVGSGMLGHRGMRGCGMMRHGDMKGHGGYHNGYHGGGMNHWN